MKTVRFRIHHPDGSVEELTKTCSAVYLEVDDVSAAMRVLAQVEGVSGVRPEPPGITFQLDSGEREAVVAALVRAGVGIETVTSRRNLEDAFLRLTTDVGQPDVTARPTSADSR